MGNVTFDSKPVDAILCFELQRLIRICADASQDYAAAAAQYANSLTNRNSVMAAKRRAKQARLALESHRQKHGC